MSIETNIDRACPQCKAEPGQPCRRPNGDKWLTPYGAPKWHAKRRRQPMNPFQVGDRAEPTGPCTCWSSTVVLHDGHCCFGPDYRPTEPGEPVACGHDTEGMALYTAAKKGTSR